MASPINPLTCVPTAEAYLWEWQSGVLAPDLGAFLRQRSWLTLDERFATILIDQRLRWQQGNGRSVEDYLCEFADVAEQLELVTDLAYGEWLARGMEGLPDAPPSLKARFPGVANCLARQAELLQWLGVEATEIVQPSRDSPDSLAL